MKLSNQIRPISYLEAHAAEIVRTLAAQGEPLVITRTVRPGRGCRISEFTSRRLSEHPRRGNYPKELLDLGIREYRELFFRPYRIIESNVYVLVIADGRRDMQSLLLQRLLQA